MPAEDLRVIKSKKMPRYLLSEIPAEIKAENFEILADGLEIKAKVSFLAPESIDRSTPDTFYQLKNRDLHLCVFGDDSGEKCTLIRRYKENYSEDFVSSLLEADLLEEITPEVNKGIGLFRIEE